MFPRTVITLTYIYYSVLLLAFISCLINFKRFDKPTRLLCIWVFLGCLTEFIAKLFAVYKGNNFLIYSVYSVIELVVIALYFNNSVRKIRQYHIGNMVIIIGLLVWVANTIWLQPIHQINSNFLFTECIFIVCLSLFSIYRQLIISDDSLTPKTHFWIPSIFIFYQSGVLLNWGFYDYFVTNSVEKAHFTVIGMLTINSITYLSFTVLLVLYPKMKSSYVF